MYALRERRVHVTQEDFEMAVAKVYFCYYFQPIIFEQLLDIVAFTIVPGSTIPLWNVGMAYSGNVEKGSARQT